MKIQAVTLFLALASVSHADDHAFSSLRVKPTVGLKGMVVCDDRKAAEWGVEILRRGGNAIDAAVATAFYMSVSRPNYASLGGGGFMIYCPQNKADCAAIDYREKAPAKASAGMFLVNGKASSELSQNSALSSGIPGVTAGLLMAHKKFGTLPRKMLLSRPIEVARAGIPFTGNLESSLLDRWKHINEAGKKIFSCGRKNSNCVPGDTVKQADLAKVLGEISAQGPDGFYKGWVAKKIAYEIQKAGGIITVDDLAHYAATPMTPLISQYKDYEIVTMPPPSSGGFIEHQLFYYAEKADRSGAFDQGFASVPTLHALATAMSLSFADRAKYLGDDRTSPTKIPLATLLSPAYLDERWKLYSPTKFKNPEASQVEMKEGNHTTHFSVIDRDGNAVAVTTTVNDNFGSAFIVEGTGVTMNNEMDDFISAPGVPNMFGLIGSKANEIAPGKTPLSSMSPTIVRNAKDKTNQITIGGQGGPRIPTGTFYSLFNRLRFGMGIADAVASARIHQQWVPAEFMYEENAFAPEVLAQLEKMGHKLKAIKASARVQAIERLADGRLWGYSDGRSEGAAVAE